MNSSKFNPLNQPGRCQHRTVSGRRCRLAVINNGTGLCFRHLAQHEAKAAALVPATIATPISPAEAADLRSALAGELKDFKSAAEINDFLSRLLLLLSENRVTPRRAAVLAYVCNLLLRTLPAMGRELDSEPICLDLGDLAKPDASSFPDSPPPSDTRALGAL